MKIDTSKIVIASLGFLALGLTLLLVRENEGRVSAETKLNDLKYRMESATNENDNLILELRGTIHDQEVKAADMNEKHRIETIAKSAEIEELQTKSDEAQKRHESMISDKDSEIADAQSKAEAEADRYELALNQKSDRVKDLGTQLEAASKRYTALLKEKESLEAKSLSLEQDLATAKNEHKKLQRENDRLTESLKVLLTPKPDTTTHD